MLRLSERHNACTKAERKQYRSHLSAKLKNNYEITKYLDEKVEYREKELKKKER